MQFEVPSQIRTLAQNAIKQNLSLPIAQRAAYKDDKGKRVAGTGMRTARRLQSGKVDIDQLYLMRAWFARHGESPKEAKARKDKTSKASIAWRLWGGSQGERWVKATIRMYERKQKKKS